MSLFTLVLLFLSIVVGIGIFLNVRSPFGSFPGIMITGICSVLLFVILVASIIVPLETGEFIEGLEAVRGTVEKARNTQKFIETAALTSEIAEVNAKLRATQYWASLPFFEHFYPQRINEIEPIQ